MKKITRREFAKHTGAAIAGLAAHSLLNTADSWATPLRNTKLELKLRQDMVPDAVMNFMLKSFNNKNKDILVKSSFVNADLGWNYEIEHALEAPAWYTQGAHCDIFLSRGPALAQLADAGVIIPIDDFLSPSGELRRDDFHSGRHGSVLDAATYRGKLWGIPLIANTYALFCNKDLFAAGGVEKAPETWEQTIAAARAMTRDTNGDSEPDVFGYSQCSFQFPLQILSAGLDIVDLKNKRVPFDTEAGLEALDVYRRCIAWSPEHVDFERGDMGMKISVTTNAFGRYKNINHFTAPLPAGRRRANTYGDSDGIVALAVSSRCDAEKQQAARRFIEFMSSEKTFFALTETAHHLPLRRSILASEKYAAYLEKYPVMKAFVNELEYAVPKPCIPEFRFIEVVMREILYPVQETSDPMSVSLDTLREHLKKQAARANELLKKSAW